MASPPFHVKALYKYNASHEDDLEFASGQIIKVTEADDDDWYTGEYTDASGEEKSGIFPRNFVEHYEPPAPPRPSRPRQKKETAQLPPPIPPPTSIESADDTNLPKATESSERSEPTEMHVLTDEPAPNVKTSKPAVIRPAPTHPPLPQSTKIGDSAPNQDNQLVRQSSVTSSKPDPPVKPASGSFKDRIAAFNKTSAPPPVPFKPSGSGASTFIKKPFVAPPPSRNAYVPPLNREPPPQKVYRREEEPDLPDQNQPELQAIVSPPSAAGAQTEVEDEDQPKPTSLKERIALLQKLQLEAQARAAEGATKKTPKAPQYSMEDGMHLLEAQAGGKLDAHARAKLEVQAEVELEAQAGGQLGAQTGAAEGDTRKTPKVSQHSTEGAQPSISADALFFNADQEGVEADGHSMQRPHLDAGIPSIHRRDSRDPVEGENTINRRSLENARTEASRTRSQIRSTLFQPAITDVDQVGGTEVPSVRRPVLDCSEPALERTEGNPRASNHASRDIVAEKHVPVHGEEEEADAEGENMDREVKRKADLRQRMAKMSGGMGMPGMFGLPGMGVGGMPPARKPSGSKVAQSAQDDDVRQAVSLPSAAPPVPGGTRTSNQRQAKPSVPSDRAAELEVEHEKEDADAALFTNDPDEVVDVEDIVEDFPPAGSRKSPPSGPLVSGGRALPPLPPPASRPTPPIPGTSQSSTPVITPQTGGPRAPSPSAGEESDDEMSYAQGPSGNDTATDSGRETRGEGLGIQSLPGRSASRKKTQLNRSAVQDDYSSSASSSVPLPIRRPAPGANMGSNASLKPARGAPPPPPSSIPRSPPPMAGDVNESEEEYEGDYDTDIAPTDDHKPALKSQDSLNDTSTLGSPPPVPPGKSPAVPTRSAPPRGVPPPPPSQPPARTSVDQSRAPPPLPSTTFPGAGEASRGHSRDESYDPFRYDRSPPSLPPQPPVRAQPPLPSAPQEQDSDEDGEPDTAPPLPPTAAPPVTQPVMAAAPPPLPESAAPPIQDMPSRRATGGPARQSLDAPRSSTTRRSLDPASRASFDASSQLAVDLDLAPQSQWYTFPDTAPPTIQARRGRDVLCEIEDSTSTKRGGKAVVERSCYVLYSDYSQTVISARFEAADPGRTAHLEQRHEAPPPALRQEALEAASGSYGSVIAQLAAQAAGHAALGDGEAGSLVEGLISSASQKVPGFRNMLPPVGRKSYGATIYANLANASVSSGADEIRRGDIVMLRNAKFQGHKGGLVHKGYSVEVGSGGIAHTAVVGEWDGSKKKVKVWEQGREGASKKDGGKIVEETYKLGDLKSGEVRVWRLVGREWVGWDS